MNDIEKKLYQAGQVHKINKNSEQILEAYQKKHSHRIQKRFIFIPTLSTLAASLVAVTLVFALSPKPINIEGKTNGFYDNSNVLTSVVSSLTLQHYSDVDVTSHNRLYANAPSQSEFEEVARDIDHSYSPFSYYQTHQEGFNYSFKSDRFEFDNVIYKYQLNVNGSSVYLKDNISNLKERGTYEGLIRLSDQYYPCEIESKVVRNKVQTSFKYRIGTSFYQLGSEKLGDNVKISLKSYFEEELSKTYSIELTKSKTNFVASIRQENDLTDVKSEHTFTQVSGVSSISLDYLKQTLDEEIRYQNITLSFTSGRGHSHVYSYEGLDNIVI